MKKKIIIVYIFLGILIIGLSSWAHAQDFMGDFVQENYKETQARFSYDPLIYHSLQINTSAGPKMLILEGKDYSYRKWLRHYIAQNKKFIIRIEDKRNDEFISSKVFSLDVTSIHPVDGNKWSTFEMMGSQREIIMGDNHILIVDSHKERSLLIKTIVEKMGYQATLFKTGELAFVPFKLQPAKFKMIIVHHESISMLPGNMSSGNISSENFIDQVLKIDHTIPVVIDTGYKNIELKKEFMTRFSAFPSVFIKPVILQELSKTIERLIQKNA
ncbi:MAG: response regulator [Pseudomonadota bacterium]